MIKKCVNTLIYCLSLVTTVIAVPEKSIVVIIPSYNNSAWYERNLDSVMAQQYGQWRALYIDDCSPDRTGELARAFIKARGFEHTITVIHNSERRGALHNLYHAIMSCADDEVVVTIDGDDWFASPYVLSRINDEYQDDAVWMTYGTYVSWPENMAGSWFAVPPAIIEANTFRQSRWMTSHLRTFYAKLFKLVRREDLLYNGEFFTVTWDMAFMFPMLEMAGFHARHISDILYVYNQSNPINDYKVRLQQVLAADAFIRSKPVYARLDTLL